MMKALTLHRPWPTFIGWRDKRHENRSWTPSPQQLRIGEEFAIHAGQKWDKDAVDFAKSIGVDISFDPDDHPKSAVVCVATYRGYVEESDSPWFFGPYGWVLTNVKALGKAVPCRGAQGIWTLPADVEEMVREQLRSMP